jgi:S1-C subfamily serine protease
MGLLLSSAETGVTIKAIPPASPPAQAGLRQGDRIVNIDGQPIRGIDDVRLALLDRAAGEQVRIEVERSESAEWDRREERVLTLL